MLSISNEICWLLQKVPVTSSHGFKTFQEFLDNKQYSRNSILRYERVFDKHFVSTGGLETTEVYAQWFDDECNTVYKALSGFPALYGFPYTSSGKQESACILMAAVHIHTSTGYL